MNEAVEFVLKMLNKPLPVQLPPRLAPLTGIVRRSPLPRLLPVPARISAIGGLPPIVRGRFDIPWSWADQRQLDALGQRSEGHTSELPSLMRIAYAVFRLNKEK